MATIETLTSDKLEAQAFHTMRPVALDFYRASCPPCRTLEPRLERMAEQYVGRVRSLAQLHGWEE